jgi:hypothetical protein
MATPGTSSGTTAFTLSNGEILFEAAERCGKNPAEITRNHMISLRRSLNLELVRWSLRGVNLWKVVEATITLVAGQATYALPSDLVTLTELWYSTQNGPVLPVPPPPSPGITTDRFMAPLTRTEYAMIPNKTQTGIPTQYWFERLAAPQLTLWQVPAYGAPYATLNYFYLQRIFDANLGSGETPDVVYRGLDALCSGITARFAEKFAPEMFKDKKAQAAEDWEYFITNDQETGPFMMTPNVSVYGRLR